MKINVQAQPSPKSCGQTVLAMALGIPVAKVIEFLGHDSTTYMSADYPRVLHHFGMDCAEHPTKVDNRKKYKLPDFCFVRIHRIGCRKGHAILHHHGMFYDPKGRMFAFSEFKTYCPRHRIDMYLEVLTDAEEAVA